MKKVILFLLIFAISFTMASIDVNNHTFKTTYIQSDNIAGKINLTINNEPINLNFTSNQGGSFSLENTLKNKVNYTCNPSDCLQSYSVSEGAENKIFPIVREKTYAGFYIKGNNVKITNLNFSLSGNFLAQGTVPLKIKFFESDDWEFNLFSDKLTSKNWGCFNPEYSSAGPLIRTSTYCELVNISESNLFFVGALVDNNSDNKELKMSIYTEQGPLIGDCTFNPSSEEGCEIKSEDNEIFSAGSYQVCVASDSPTNYHIFTDSSDLNCGFIYSDNPNSSVKNYGIFAKRALYASAQSLNSDNIDKEILVERANNFLTSKYDGNCSAGCVLPIEINGIPQNLQFSDISLDYLKNGEDYVENTIYEINPLPAFVNFKGILDLSSVGLKVNKEGEYILNLGNKQILKEKISFIPAPIIKGISPINPPAGVPVTFYLGVEYNGSLKSVGYKWNFGDNTSEKTQNNFIVHTYDEIKNYTLSVEVIKDNLTIKKNFTIRTISPQNAVNASLTQKRKSLDKLTSSVNNFPSWLLTPLKSKINISYYENLVSELEKNNKNASSPNDFLKIATTLYSTNFPQDIYIEESQIPLLLTKLSDISPEVVALVSEEKISDTENYKDQILAWQDENINADILSKKITLVKEDLTKYDIFSYYSLRIIQNSEEESYLVIDKPADELFFKDINPVKSGDSSVITMNGGAKLLEFYYFDTSDEPIFVSPKLSTLIINVNKNCNFNQVCEEEENYKTCRSDCKPYSKAIIYVIIAFFVFLFFYTLLQLWYKNHYENFLFRGDRRQIYNLLMFVANARARGVKDNEIIKSLKAQGWNSEKISYIMKKSYGKRVGMAEIIPLSKISAFMINKKAQKDIQNGGKRT